MWPLLSAIGPRVLIPGVFVGQKVQTMSDPALISQTIAFSFLFVSFALLVFSDKAWLSIIPGVAALAYWNMMKDSANLDKYRYADWAITTPLMIFAILQVNNTPFVKTLSLLVLDLVMIVSGYYGAKETDHTKKIIAFVFGCVVLIPILFTLYHMKKAKYAIYLTLAMWILYPIVWYAEEESILTKQNSTITYSVMDVIAKVGLVNLLHI